MVSVLSWENTTRPADEADKLDPMSVWIAGDGRDFAEHLVSRAGFADLDFRYVAAIDAADPIASIAAGRSLVAIMDQDLESNTGLIVEDFSQSLFYQRLQMKDPRLFLLPLRADSVLTMDQRMKGDPLKRIARSTFKSGGPMGVAPQQGRPIVGVIDHGINVAHERFRNGADSRVKHAWDQGGVYEPTSGVPFGREFSAAQLTQMIAQCGDDEHRLLTQLGFTDFARPGERPLAYAQTHGTHVLDLAAGEDPANAQDAPDIIAVNLPPVVAREPSGAFLGIFFIQGVEYILSRARALPNPGPIVLNFSFALSGGPRKGQHILERSLNALLDHHYREGGPSVTVVLPAGNRNIAGGHAVRPLSSDTGGAQFDWQLQPGDATSNMLEIWISGSDFREPDLQVTLTPPGGSAITTTLSNDTGMVRRLMAGSDVVGRCVLRRAEGALVLTMILAATDPGQTGRTPAPPGCWGVMVRTPKPDGHVAEAWVMRDDTIPGFHDNGRQSYLIDPQAVIRDLRGVPIASDDAGTVSGLRRAGTLNALATGQRSDVVTVGAAVAPGGTTRLEPSPALYSATPLPDNSPLSRGERIGLSAIADRSGIRSGVLAAGTRSGSRVAMGGTSVAAPQVARALAEDMTIAPSVGQQNRRVGSTVMAAPHEMRRKT